EELSRAHSAGTPYQLAVLDYHMPKMDGLELAHTIKADAQLRDTVLVMLSSVTHRAGSEQLSAAGCAAYLVKPVHQSDLMDVLANAWSTRNDVPQGSRMELLPSYSRFHTAVLPAGRSRARVLVVEDNAVNQKVAKHMLEGLGCRVDVAGDGRAALELIESVPFDLVFMDVQMPVMDGLSATMELRRREDGHSRHLPIVAMTAHAQQIDRERCLAAGMDAYLSKPVRRRDLLRTLRELGPWEADAESAKPPPRRPAAVDLVWLAENYDPDPAEMAALLQQFVTQADTLLEQMARAQDDADQQALRSHAHKLKGSAGMVGAKPLAAMLQGVQLGGPFDAARARAELDEVRLQLATELGGSPTSDES
ncbi:MAG: response regulator, partial [Nannocystaceae bacterium]